jgi:ATP-binding cassette, subfamily G (WHITE), member 2, SNQ2
LATFCGVTIPYPTMMRFWRVWLYPLDPYTRTLAVMVSTELQCVQLLTVTCLAKMIDDCSGLIIRCKSDEFAVFNPPSGQTCAQWGQEFVNSFGGYIDNLNDTVACRYCQYAVGDQFFLPLNMRFSDRGRDAFILFSYIGEFKPLFCDLPPY